MATKKQDKEPEPAAAGERERLLVVGNPVVSPGGDQRLQLSGELTDEQYEALGEARVKSLRAAGHLKTQEELDQEDEARAAVQKIDPNQINPNFGTPSMTPEAQARAKASGNPDVDPADGSTLVATSDPQGSLEARPVSDLDVDDATRACLEAAGLKTVGDVMRYGEENDRLTAIEGIGDAREEQVKDAIDALEKDSGAERG